MSSSLNSCPESSLVAEMTQMSTFLKDLKNNKLYNPIPTCNTRISFCFSWIVNILQNCSYHGQQHCPCLASTWKWTQAWRWWRRCWGWTQTSTHFPSFSQTSEKQSTFNVFLLTIPNYSTYSTMPGPTAASYLCAKCDTAYDY